MASDREVVSLPDGIDPAGSSKRKAVVWHRRQLRTRDHPALASAAREYEAVLPLFVFDPHFYSVDGLACDGRIVFLHDCLRDLDEQYQRRGGTLSYAHTSPESLMTAFSDSGWDILATADPTGRYGLRRDNAVAESAEVTFVDADGLVRTDGDSRAGWSDHIEEWFGSSLHGWDESEVAVETASTGITPGDIEREYDVVPQKQSVPRGGTAPAVSKLTEFVENIEDYPGSISSPADARTGTSQLSPYLRFGCLSVRQIYQQVDAEVPDGRAKQMFVSRLYWNRHYSQKLVDYPGWMDTAVNPAMAGFHQDSHDPDLVNAWKAGRTGYPMVDASMRCLRETGWLNFRMRAMCASFLCDLLQQPWKIGADWFYYHLIDADPAINYTQFQIQAGVDGTNMMRVYNPRKQVRDNDPDGEFIHRWVPELRPVPPEYLDRPERIPVGVQAECGVSIGEDYPYPIVEYEAARERIFGKLEGVKPEAKAALKDDVVRQRASLSRRGRVEDDPSSADRDQESAADQETLDSF